MSMKPEGAKPDLACAVLSLAGQPCLVEAVRSLLDQAEPVEVVLVNSGGGDPAALLGAAGIRVPVIDHPAPLFPGAVRNLGIDATRAPFVSFLAADCRAEPGWAAARLREHRAGAQAVAGVITNPFPGSRSATASLLLLHNRRLPDTAPARRLFYGLSYDRTLFNLHGRFREDLRTGEDTEFKERLHRNTRVAWAADVRTAHLFPTRPADLVREQYRRGKLRAIAARRNGGPRGRTIARRAVMRVARCLRVARGAPDPAERRRRTRAWPLLLPGALSYAAGAVNWRGEARRIATSQTSLVGGRAVAPSA
jgi:glycosyltransferase involved in cell wall biosynthesis